MHGRSSHDAGASTRMRMHTQMAPAVSSSLVLSRKRRFASHHDFPVFAAGNQTMPLDRLVVLVVKTSASGAVDPGFDSCLRHGICTGRVTPGT